MLSWIYWRDKIAAPSGTLIAKCDVRPAFDVIKLQTWSVMGQQMSHLHQYFTAMAGVVSYIEWVTAYDDSQQKVSIERGHPCMA